MTVASVSSGAHLYVADLDGTLLRSDATLSPFTRSRLTELLADGLLFTIATARALPSIRAILGDLPLRLPVIAQNGAVLADGVSGEILRAVALRPALAAELLDLFTGHGLTPFVDAVNGGAASLYHPPLANAGMRWFRDEKHAMDDPRLREVPDVRCALSGQVLGLTVLGERSTLAPLASALLARRADLRVQFFEHPYCPGFWELAVNDALATKATAVSALQTRLSLSPSSLTVFGDQTNDLDMFEAAARGVAVRNAVPEILAVATHFAESNEDDGVVRWLVLNHRAPAG
jgi:5-amino-6-(5-phospho-D-ribitylamino)uracil phosphatase